MPSGVKDETSPCPYSGVGQVPSRVYNENGQYEHEHEVEDACFSHKISEICYVYGVLSSFDGPKATEFCRKHVASEIARMIPYEMLSGARPNDHDYIESVLVSVFDHMEKRFFESLDATVAQRTMLRMQLPEKMAESEDWWLSSTQNREVFDKMQKLDREVRGACCMLVCLLLNGTLYCANAGNCRALLCRVMVSQPTGEAPTTPQGSGGDQRESNGDANTSGSNRALTDDTNTTRRQKGAPVMRIVQLNTEHNLLNESERSRLTALNVRLAGDALKLDNRPFTRVIGDYFIKHEYRNVDVLRNARSEPIICTPEVSRIELNVETECGYLLLFTDGVRRAFTEVLGGAVNRNMVEFVAQEFSAQRTIQSVAQATLDRLARSHHDAFQAIVSAASLQQRAPQSDCSRLDELVLLVRNVNYPLPQAILPTQTSRTLLNLRSANVGYGSSDTQSNTLVQQGDQDNDDDDDDGPGRTVHTGLTCDDDDDDDDDEDEDEEDDEGTKQRRRAEESEATNRPVNPFVDFGEVMRAFEELRTRNRPEYDALMAELDIRTSAGSIAQTPSTSTSNTAAGSAHNTSASATDTPNSFVPNSDSEMFV